MAWMALTSRFTSTCCSSCRLMAGRARGVEARAAPRCGSCASRWPTSTRQSSSTWPVCTAVDVAGKLGRPGELQQLRDDQPHALDLLVDQIQLGRTRPRGAAQQLAQQVEVALDHRDRVVDLVRDAGRELAHRGQLLVAHQLGLRVGQLARALGHLGVELGVPALQLARLVVDGVQQLVQVRGQRPISSPLATGPRGRPARRPRTRCIVASICSSGRKMLRAQRSDTTAAATITAKNSSADAGQRRRTSAGERRSRKPT
jgi:hypothetical protein